MCEQTFEGAEYVFCCSKEPNQYTIASHLYQLPMENKT